MSNSDLDECVNCGEGLIKVSDICPQCGWKKNKPIEPDISKENSADDIENDLSVQEPAVVKNKIIRPTGVKFISIAYMVFGISLILFGIVFVSAVMFLVMSDVMGELGGIGGSMGNMPMLPGMGGMDASTKSSLDSIINLNTMVGSSSASEIEMRVSSSGIMNMDAMMEILGEASVIALIEIIVGLVIFVVGICLAKGKKLARPVTILSSIISIPLVLAFVTSDTLVLLGMVAFNGIIIYYMLKSKARDYFNQTSTKKSKPKDASIVNVKSVKIEPTVESAYPQDKPTMKFASTQSRPLGITIIAILQILSGMFDLSVGLFSGTLSWLLPDVVPPLTVILGLVGAGYMILGVAKVVTAWGVLKGKSWAWKFTLILIIIGIILAAIREDVGGIIVSMVFGVIFVYYLFRPHVKEYFGIILKTTN